MTTPAIRILVVDDHAMIRLGLIGALSSEPGMEVVGQARNGREAVELHAKLAPDITLMDGILPDMHGVEVTRVILTNNPTAKIIFISINETAEDIHRALEAGVRGYVPKSCEQDTISEAIRSVAAGEDFLPPQLALRLAERNAYVGLSNREVEVLRLVAKGTANKQIAAALHLSGDTVKTHLAHIMRKLGAADRAHAVTLAIEKGFLRM
ncbi:MAG: response regulator transcription factor [Akkermansiaceae bacterium]|jgi:two-component system NarL family response regulator|nr:response regulator transcription factor [Akkermansiaceae bacterium]